MDIESFLQDFEATMSSYSGPDPLDQWDRFVEFLDCRLPAEQKNSMCVVLERLVQTFLQDEHYHNDIRYINHCIRCASYYSEPIKLYMYVHSRGVGVRACGLYVAWAQQYERKGLFSQAEKVYQRAIENQAEPLDTIQQQYKLFQSRTTKSHSAPLDHVRNPLQNSQLVNQDVRQRETLQPQCKEPENPLLPAVRIISRSENNPKSSSSAGGVEYRSMYCRSELECEASELSFEELRARRYFTKIKQQEMQRKQEEALRRYKEEEEEVERMKKCLEELNSKPRAESQQTYTALQQGQFSEELFAQNSLDRLVRPTETEAPAPVCPSDQPSLSFMGLQQVPGHPLMAGRKSESHLLWNNARVPASRLSLSLSAASRTQHTNTNTLSTATNRPSDSHSLQPAEQRTVSQAEDYLLEGYSQHLEVIERDASEEAETGGDNNADMSHGFFNHSHVTPNTSLGLISATPSRALPSPTVNTREALDVIMDMFQAPTLLQDTLFNTTNQPADDSFERNCRVSAPSQIKAASAMPFRIYQDENAENKSQCPVEKTRPAVRALTEIPVSKPNDTPVSVESLTDESAMWGPRYTSITTCPNHTRDFALSAHLVSTPLHPTNPYTWETQHTEENAASGFSGTEENPFQRQPAKLSPILEQSPSEEKPPEAAESSLRGQGTIVGEGVSLPHQNQTFSQSQNQTTCSISRHPLVPLAFHDQSAETSKNLNTSTKPSWTIYQSPEKNSKAGPAGELHSHSMHLVTEPKPDQLQSTSFQVNSNTSTKPNWNIYQSPEKNSKTGPVGELHSNSMHLERDPKPDQLHSASFQVNSSTSTKPNWNIYQSPERPSKTGPIEEIHSHSLQVNSTTNSSTKPTWNIYQSPERTSKTGPIGELYSNSMMSVREPKPNLHSASFQVGSTTSSSTKPSWNIYQSPERPSKSGPIGELHSHSMHLVREPKPDQFLSTSLHVNSKPNWNIYQSPERTSKTGPVAELHSNSFQVSSSTKPSWNIYQSPEKTNKTGPIGELYSNSMHLVRDPKPDLHSTSFQVNTNSNTSTKPNWSIYQSPERTSKTGPVGELLSHSLMSVREPKPDQFHSASFHVGTKPNWNIYESPERTNQDGSKRDFLEQSGFLLSKRSFNRRRSEKRVLEITQVQKSVLSSPKQTSIQDVSMSPEPALLSQKHHSNLIQDVSMTPEPAQLSLKQASNPNHDVPMSPEPAPGLSWLCTDSPAHVTEPDLDVLMTPQQTSKTSAVTSAQQLQTDVLMSSAPDYSPSVLVSDPWDEDLISSLLSSLKSPLSSYPNLNIWSVSLPSISPRMTIQMADESLKVDSVLGQGAFATVYQATNLTTSQKLILKVQKPANPWEFYIDRQLNTRLRPRVRHLYNQLYSAHLFTNGSVLVGEVHTCGTLLNVMNLYKSRGEKVMPVPLVLYFTVCILQMVEQLHQAKLIHADIKPDNFLLGERFLENEDFDAESLDHGLVLIDFGQSIDMTLFPEDTAFTARCMTSGFQCTEMLSGRPWNYQTDYFGIAGTVYCMIFGSYMQVRNEGGVWKTNGVFKRNPHSDLWQDFFHTLLNIPDCTALPSLRSLRERVCETLMTNYSNKLHSVKNRLVVQILETRSSRR